MDIDEPEVSRLLRGDVPNDDPVWGQVSAFLNDVGTAYPTVSTTAFEDRHLEAVARESRLVHIALRHPRQGAVKRMFQGTHRILAGSVAACLIALTAGVGVASALGVNPLGQLMSHFPVSSPAAPAATTSRTAGTNDPAPGKQEGEPGTTAPRVVPGPTLGASPSATASESSGKPTADQAEKDAAKAAKDAAKAEKKAAKDAEKARKAAEKAAAQAKKKAEKAAEAKPGSSPTKGKGKQGDAGGNEPDQEGGKKP